MHIYSWEANSIIHTCTQHAWHDVFYLSSNTDSTMHAQTVLWLVFCECLLFDNAVNSLAAFSTHLRCNTLVMEDSNTLTLYMLGKLRRNLMKSHKQAAFGDFLKISISCVKENCDIYWMHQIQFFWIVCVFQLFVRLVPIISPHKWEVAVYEANLLNTYIVWHLN